MATKTSGTHKPCGEKTLLTSAQKQLSAFRPNATFTAKHVIRVTKAKNRRAKAIGGTSKVTIVNCSFATFVNYTFKGTIR